MKLSMEIYDREGEFCNSTGVIRMIGLKAGFSNCREAAYLNILLEAMLPVSYDVFNTNISNGVK